MAQWRSDASSYAKAAFSQKPEVNILEVGGGSFTHVMLEGARYTTLDISPEQLEKNTYASEKILGDAQTVDYGSRVFDICIFWDILEHIEKPSAALKRGAAALCPGGMMIIKGPILSSAKGIFTHATPRWVHVLFYRHVLKQPNAGKPGYAPFEVEHSSEASHGEIIAILEQQDMEIAFVGEYVSTQVHALKARIPPLYWLYEAIGMTLRTVSAGKIGGRETEFLIIARKMPGSLIQASN